MDRIEALNNLLAKVEAKHAKHNPEMWFMEDAQALGLSVSLIARAYGGSMDAAQSLHSVVLPDWSFEMRLSGYGLGQAGIWNPAVRPSPNNERRVDVEGNPARALLICIIQQLIETPIGGMPSDSFEGVTR